LKRENLNHGRIHSSLNSSSLSSSSSAAQNNSIRGAHSDDGDDGRGFL
jgi:hypothetical protein